MICCMPAPALPGSWKCCTAPGSWRTWWPTPPTAPCGSRRTRTSWWGLGVGLVRLVREYDVVGGAGRGWEQDEQEAQARCRADELRDDERGNGARRDAGERVAEDAAHRHCGVRERGRGCEPVRCADVGAHRRRRKHAP